MDKNILRKMVRESILALERNVPVHRPMYTKPQSEPKAAPKPKTRQDNAEYADIQHALDDTILTKSQVMGAAGLGDPDDAGDRRAFNAKLDREPNEEGSIRKFNPKELAAVSKVVSNPAAYLGKKVHHKK